VFKKLTTKNDLGIDRYKSIDYAWERPFLKGRVSALEEKPGEFFVSAEPNLPRMRAMDGAAQNLTSIFNEARNLTLSLGQYASLDAVEAYVHKLEALYGTVLTEQGAARRVLRGAVLQPTNQDTLRTFGEALKRARNEEIFGALRAGQPVPFEQIAGRLLRPLANALNVSYTEEVERHADDKRRYQSIAYTYDGLATFLFLDNGPEDFPTVIRQSYNNGRYQQTYTGPATLDNMQRHVFTWLADALRERQAQENPETPAALIRDISFADLTEYAAPDHKSLWHAIRRGERDDIFTGRVPHSTPDAMLAQYHETTGTAPGVPDARPAVRKAPHLRLIK
jgi:hypothetical protein